MSRREGGSGQQSNRAGAWVRDRVCQVGTLLRQTKRTCHHQAERAPGIRNAHGRRTLPPWPWPWRAWPRRRARQPRQRTGLRGGRQEWFVGRRQGGNMPTSSAGASWRAGDFRAPPPPPPPLMARGYRHCTRARAGAAPPGTARAEAPGPRGAPGVPSGAGQRQTALAAGVGGPRHSPKPPARLEGRPNSTSVINGEAGGVGSRGGGVGGGRGLERAAKGPVAGVKRRVGVQVSRAATLSCRACHARIGAPLKRCRPSPRPISRPRIAWISAGGPWTPQAPPARTQGPLVNWRRSGGRSHGAQAA